MSNRTVILQRPMTSKTTIMSTGTAGQSNQLLLSIENRKYLRIMHADPDNAGVIPTLSFGGSDAGPNTFPLGAYAGYWEAGVPSTSVYIYCTVDNLKVCVEEGF